VHTLNGKKSSDTVRVVPEREEAFRGPPGEVVEVPLLLSAGQMYALEEAAHEQGLTAAEMFRRVLHEFIAAPNSTMKARAL
jgi:hypothetical protein